nr:MAG TPA: DEXDc-like helicases superfamily [Caudoviricetes sp.]
MTVKVCDALCGAGKTSASINMINDRTDTKFIFVTQYLSETERIKNACPSRNFVLPDSNNKSTKLNDTNSLLREGRNIATTHSLFVTFTDETKRLIMEQGYVLILDEVVDILRMSDIKQKDIDILLRSESICEKDGTIEWTNAEYQNEEGGRFHEEMMQAKSKNLYRYDGGYYFWSIPPELFTCFKETYVLTYMFEAQTLRCFFELYEIPYALIGTRKENGAYQFCSIEDMDRRRELRDKIHILNHKKLNAIGSKRTALSTSWYDRAIKNLGSEDCELDRIRKNINNLFKNVWSTKASELMWTTFKDARSAVAAKGYMNAFVTYNKRASNDYADRTHLAYCVNNFPRPWEERYYREHGVRMDGDMYALSILIQWIFRSAIRNGEEIWVYIPSARMRALLIKWLDNLAEGKDLEPIKYTSPRKPRNKSKRKD